MYAATVITTHRRTGRDFTRRPARTVAQVQSIVEVLAGEHDGFVRASVIPVGTINPRTVLALAEDIRPGATPLDAQRAARDWDAWKRGE